MNKVFLIGIVSAICSLPALSKHSEKIHGNPLTTYPKIFWWVECRVPCKSYMRCFPSWLAKTEMTFPPCGFDAYFANQPQECQNCLWENSYPTTIKLTHPMLTYDTEACQETAETTTTAITADLATAKVTTSVPPVERICQCRRVQTVKTITVGSSCHEVADRHGACHVPERSGPQIITTDESRCFCKSRPMLQQGSSGGSKDKKKKKKKGDNMGSKKGNGGNVKHIRGMTVNNKSKGVHSRKAGNGKA